MSAPRSWFITAVRTGFGRALAEAVLARGEKVAGTVRRDEDRAAFEALAPGRAFAFVCDVADEPAVARAVTGAEAALEGIDVVVNNAGYGIFGAVEEVSDAEARAQFDTNVFGVWNVLRAALPLLRGRRRGHVVQVSSIAGLAAGGFGGAYNASKFALEGLSEALAFELAPFGIHVTLIEPGMFRTDFAGSGAKAAARALEAYPGGAAGAPGRFAALHGTQPGDPARFADAVLQVVDSPRPPLRLLLGHDALRRARTKLDWMRGEVEAWATVSAATAYEGTPESSGLPVFVPPEVT